VVLLINPRGSTGYGQDFCKAIYADWGNLDYQDVMAGVDYSIAQGYTDPDKLWMVLWWNLNQLCVKTNRFKAALSGASEALFRANYGHDHYQHLGAGIGLPWESSSLGAYFAYNDVAKITTPTLWMGGSDDWNVPILNSEQMYLGMKRLGRETQLVVYPDEYHGQKTFISKRPYGAVFRLVKKYVNVINPSKT
jgi:dipeptidyl aminopeptidase/acylaminoacyl peptidase